MAQRPGSVAPEQRHPGCGQRANPASTARRGLALVANLCDVRLIEIMTQKPAIQTHECLRVVASPHKLPPLRDKSVLVIAEFAKLKLLAAATGALVLKWALCHKVKSLTHVLSGAGAVTSECKQEREPGIHSSTIVMPRHSISWVASGRRRPGPRKRESIRHCPSGSDTFLALPETALAYKCQSSLLTQR